MRGRDNILYLQANQSMPTQHRIKIDLLHPNAQNAEAFLNSWDEPFIQEEEETNRFVFCSTVSKTNVALYFFNSWAEADAFGNEHFNPVSDNRMWSLNGAMLFVVSGKDAYRLRDLLSHFAGQE